MQILSASRYLEAGPRENLKKEQWKNGSHNGQQVNTEEQHSNYSQKSASQHKAGSDKWQVSSEREVPSRKFDVNNKWHDSHKIDCQKNFNG
ncbi:hypothetical protein AVEN_193974-1 [Araneus ventricosus]|uniref:Uncharacterized protein n=1 Tax=Araneus ventricosus TaxID=182803 RepID=A0A4Y2SMW3_ARAVE|nr:hypothetical protein AVEN_193974-1 [Araneus ventricosus]